MDVADELLSRLRHPEYTGENRCLPCTVVNVGIAVVASGAVGGLVGTAASPTAGVAAALAAFALAAVVIALRGYLVPGTPTLTMRYFPAQVLAAFGKEPAVDYRADGGFDQEAVLTDLGALEPCADGQDLCLAEEFRTAWYREIDRVDDDEEYDGVFDLVTVDDGDVSVEEIDSSLQVRVNGSFVGVWKSPAAFIADMGAASVLSDRSDGWEDFDGSERHQLVSGLRLFIDECPTCGAVPEFGTEVVETCCDAREVAAVDCTDCGARLFETPT